VKIKNLGVLLFSIIVISGCHDEEKQNLSKRNEALVQAKNSFFDVVQAVKTLSQEVDVCSLETKSFRRCEAGTNGVPENVLKGKSRNKYISTLTSTIEKNGDDDFTAVISSAAVGGESAVEGLHGETYTLKGRIDKQTGYAVWKVDAASTCLSAGLCS
jgi:PBP1b-binding outer membrane lipoprotein LpoB